MENLEDYVAALFGIDTAELFTPTRRRVVVEARQLCMTCLRRYTDASTSIVGQYFNRDHSTVVASCFTFADLYETDKALKTKADDVYNKCKRLELNLPFNPSPVRYFNCNVNDEELILQ